uniref:Uncharacterized protein n=1 Tax=Ditylenchus dipsaci TaxID=166011 RepID=A0A915EAH7_9BILA
MDYTDQFQYELSEPDILIGNDNYYKINPTVLSQLSNGYHLLKTEIGPMIGGDTRLVPQLIFSKNKLKPSKSTAKLNIHRLKLLGIFLAAKLVTFLRAQLDGIEPEAINGPIRPLP